MPRLHTNHLFTVMYDELRALATSLMRAERRAHTLQPTALVHEAYIRLSAQRSGNWQSREQFYSVVMTMMRRTLVNYGEAGRTAKRGAGYRRVPLIDDRPGPDGAGTLVEMVALGEALSDLRRVDARQADVVELRYLCGLSFAEIAQLVGLSPRTVAGDWAHARAWLRGRIASERPT